MLSFKPLKENRSRHIASIEDKGGNCLETLWLTELKDRYDQLDSNFAEEMKKYVTEDSTPENFFMKKGYKLSILPSNYVTDLHRDSIAIFGVPGSGKTWQINNYITNYKALHPRNKVYYYSINKQDESMDEVIEEMITRVKLWEVDSVIDVMKEANTLHIFDDVVDANISIDPRDVYGEEYTLASFKDQIKMQKDCIEKAKMVRYYINQSASNILLLGRKYHIGCMIVYHELRGGKAPTTVVNLSSGCWLFPYTESRDTVCDYIKQRLSFSRKHIKELESEVFYPHDFMCVNKAGKRYYFTPNHFKFLLWCV